MSATALPDAKTALDLIDSWVETRVPFIPRAHCYTVAIRPIFRVNF